MKRRLFFAVGIVILSLSPLAMAAYNQAWTRPTCSGGLTALYDDKVGISKELSSSVLGLQVPVIEYDWTADGTGNEPLILAITDTQTVGAESQIADGYWTGNGFSATVLQAVAFKAYKNTSGSLTPTGVFTVSFENLTVTSSNPSDIGYSDVSWHLPTATMPVSGPLYWLIDADNKTGSAAAFGANRGRATCTGGDPGSTFFVGTVGSVSAEMTTSMVYRSTAEPVLNGAVSGCSSFALNWAAPGNFPNLTSYRVYRNSSVYPVNRTFSVPPEGNFSLRLLNDTYPKISAALAYSVVGVNASGGASPPSNVVSFTPPAISSVGDCGLAFGGMAKSEFLEMAGLTGASEDALGILLSIVLVLAGAGAGFAIMAAGGAAMGAAAGMLLSVALGYLPLWAIMFSLGLLVGGYFISKPGAGRRRGK